MPLERFPCNPILYYLKQSCDSKVNRLFLQLFSLSKNCMLDEVWGCVEILPYPLVIEGGKGKISAQPHTIVKQICFPNGNLLFVSLFSQSKN